MTQESPSVDHRTTFSGCIFATKENLLNSNISSTCRHNMVNVGPLTAEIRWWVWGTPANFKVVSRLGCVTARHSGSGCQPNFEALNRGRHLYSAGRPSRWALAHILFSYKSVSTTIEGTSVLLWPLLTNHNFVYPSKHHAVDTNFFCLSLT